MRRIASVLLLAGLAGSARAENWPFFRGPTHQGVSQEHGLPIHWSDTDNIAWKTPIPGQGWSSPVVWDERVFVTTATEEGATFRALCLDRRSGKTLWNQDLGKQTLVRKESKNSYATPTPVTDGQRLYVMSFNGQISALDMQGAVLWTNHEVDFYSRHGLGTSPILYKNLVIVAFDGSSKGPDKEVGWKKPWNGAVILAIDKHTGETRWTARRGLSRIAHVVPNILNVAGNDFLISSAGNIVQAFDLATGARSWSVENIGEGVVPSLVVGGGLIFATCGWDKPAIRAVSPVGSGEQTGPHVVWEWARAVPMVPSMLYIRPYLFTISERGIAQCLEADTGKLVWQNRIGGQHAASPIVADGRIYFLSDEGEATVIQAGPEFQLIARNALHERCFASYAVSQGNLFIRAEKNLYCIGKVQQ
jgi:outer membrane protein assembly factor BamB